MAKTLANLQQSLAQVEAKLDKLYHYRRYLISRIDGLSEFSPLLGDDSVVPTELLPVYCGSWANVTTIRVADDVSAATALSDPTVKLLRPSSLVRDMDEFVRNCNSEDPGERFECWATFCAWWRVANDWGDEALLARVLQAVSLCDIPGNDERVAHFERFVRTFTLEDPAKAHPVTGVTD